MRRQPADHETRELAAQAVESSIFLDAGAGCGKTQALTDRYLNLLEAGLTVSQIVAVTFTNKAARDMRARLRERCEERANALERDRGRALQSPTSEADASQAAVWLHRARELESAPISTIHAFCSSLLRRYAIKADLDPNFAVLDDIRQRLLLSGSVREALLRRLDADEQTAALVVSQLGLAEGRAAIEKLISQREQWQAQLDTPPTPKQLAAQWEAMAAQITEERLNLLVSSLPWLKCVSALRQHASCEPSDKLEVLRRQMLLAVETAENRTLRVDQRLGALRDLLSLGQVPGKGKGWDSDECSAAVADACRNLKNAGKRPAELIKELCLAEKPDPLPSAELTSAVLVEAHHALQGYVEAKAEQSALDYEDLQLFVRDLLRDNPAVRRDCHDRYRQMLVDEFQDTNSLQKELLWLAAGAEPGQAPPPGRLFVVGDAKQSIYRFRDADVTVFDETRREFSEAEGHERLRLSVTFRNRPALSDLHNAMFNAPALLGPDYEGRPPYAAFYEPLNTHRLTENNAAPCDLILVQSDGSGSNVSAEYLRQQEAFAIADWVKQAVGTLPVYKKGADGEEVERPLEPGDIALLFRSTSDLRLYTRALDVSGLRYHVSSGRGFFKRQEVLDLLNLLGALENWRDEIALAGALRSPLFGLSDETLFWLKIQPGQLREQLKLAAAGEHPHQQHLAATEFEAIRFADEQLAELQSLKNRLPLSTLLSEIITRTGYTAALAGLFGGEQMLSNLRKLIDLARGFESGGSYSLRDFVDYLRDLVVAEERMSEAPTEEEDANCLKLMTIHAAKGLEWRVVILPDLDRGDNRPSKGVWRYHQRHGLIAAPQEGDDRLWPELGLLISQLEEAEDLAEFRRLFYVAATRSRDHLVLSSALGFRKVGVSWLDMLSEALQIDTQSATCPTSLINMIPVVAEDLKEPAPPPPDPGHVHVPPPAEFLRRRLAPVAPDYAGLTRFTVTGLSAYRTCGMKYQLHSLQGLPDDRVAGHLPDSLGTISALERGSLVHRALEIIGSRGESATDEALNLTLQSGQIAPAERDEIEAMLAWYLQTGLYLERVQQASRLRSEMPLSFRLGDALIEGKLDAVAEQSDGVTVDVIDYKTGYGEGEGEDEHRFQLGLYCAGLEALGKTVRSATIVYLDGQRLQELEAEDFSRAEAEAAEAVAGIRTGQFSRGQGCNGCALG
ncbi:MAG: UvrD-helicase domain-containing protein, partial [Armatimonadia bacterium]